MENKELFIEFTKKTLELDDFEMEDYIFEKGVNSIQLIRFVNILNEELEIELTFVDLFAAESFNGLFEKIMLLKN